MILTQAQITICHAQLRGAKCPICYAKKIAYIPLCKGCYFALPEDLRPGLWIDRTDTKSLIEFSERYFKAKDWLRKSRSQAA